MFSQLSIKALKKKKSPERSNSMSNPLNNQTYAQHISTFSTAKDVRLQSAVNKKFHEIDINARKNDALYSSDTRIVGTPNLIKNDQLVGKQCSSKNIEPGGTGYYFRLPKDGSCPYYATEVVSHGQRCGRIDIVPDRKTYLDKNFPQLHDDVEEICSAFDTTTDKFGLFCRILFESKVKYDTCSGCKRFLYSSWNGYIIYMIDILLKNTDYENDILLTLSQEICSCLITSCVDSNIPLEDIKREVVPISNRVDILYLLFLIQHGESHQDIDTYLPMLTNIDFPMSHMMILVEQGMRLEDIQRYVTPQWDQIDSKSLLLLLDMNVSMNDIQKLVVPLLKTISPGGIVRLLESSVIFDDIQSKVVPLLKHIWCDDIVRLLRYSVTLDDIQSKVVPLLKHLRMNRILQLLNDNNNNINLIYHQYSMPPSQDIDSVQYHMPPSHDDPPHTKRTKTNEHGYSR